MEIIDVNENLNKPKFAKLAYEGSVKENASPGTEVVQVKATDGDVAMSDHRIVYTIRRGSGLGTFSIDSNGKCCMAPLRMGISVHGLANSCTSFFSTKWPYSLVLD